MGGGEASGKGQMGREEVHLLNGRPSTFRLHLVRGLATGEQQADNPFLSLTLGVQRGAELSVGLPAPPLQTVTGTSAHAALCAALEARGSAHGHLVQGIFTASKPVVTTSFSPHPQLCDGQEGHKGGEGNKQVP